MELHCYLVDLRQYCIRSLCEQIELRSLDIKFQKMNVSNSNLIAQITERDGRNTYGRNLGTRGFVDATSCLSVITAKEICDTRSSSKSRKHDFARRRRFEFWCEAGMCLDKNARTVESSVQEGAEFATVRPGVDYHRPGTERCGPHCMPPEQLQESAGPYHELRIN